MNLIIDHTLMNLLFKIEKQALLYFKYFLLLEKFGLIQ